MKILSIIAIILISACNASSGRDHSNSFTTRPSPVPGERVFDVSEGGQRRVEEVHRGVQTVCRVDGREFPPSYLVSDLGKAGVPQLDQTERHQALLISRYVHDPTLRFQEISGQFLVYDAQWGPCMLAAPGYWVLNAKDCNLYFMPADEWSGPSAVPGCLNPPRPWVPGDGGDSAKHWADFPPAGIFTPAPIPK